MAKPFVKVTLILHGSDDALRIDDYVGDDGRFVPIGTQAAAAPERRDQIHYVDAEGYEIIIPFHAIVASNVTKETGEFTPLEDEFCKEDMPVDRGAVVGTAIVDVDKVGE